MVKKQFQKNAVFPFNLYYLVEMNGLQNMTKKDYQEMIQ